MLVADAASCGVEYERLVTVHGALEHAHRGAGELLDALYAMDPDIANDYRNPGTNFERYKRQERAK